MKEYLQDCRSLQDLAIPTEDYYLLLNTKKIVHSVRVSKNIANYFKNKNNLKDYLNDYTILENSLYGYQALSRETDFTVIKYNEYYSLSTEFYDSVFNKYNINPDFEVNMKLSGIYEEDGYWLKIFYDIPDAYWAQIEEDMEKIDEI